MSGGAPAPTVLVLACTPEAHKRAEPLVSVVIRALAAGALFAFPLFAQAPAAKTAVTADLGVVSASGNTRLRTMNIGDKIVHTTGRWAFSQIAAYVYGETADITSANQLRGLLRADYSIENRLSAFAGGSYERNRFAGFTRRTDEILGLSWKALTEPFDSLALDGGGVLTQEGDVDGVSKSFPAARFAGNYKHAFTKTSYFQQLAEYLPNLQTHGEYRVNTESAVVAPLSSHMGIKFGYVVRFNSAPPPTFGKTDRILTSGIQVSF
jgi:putative salt-induced outer membrane protein